MKILITSLLIIYSTFTFGQSLDYPFPNHTEYTGNHIKPNNYTQTELDNQTRTFYESWKAEYLKNDCGNSNEYYIFSGNDAKNVSEAQGYGMMITVYFAGYDPEAQTYFDGLYRFYKSHPSIINSTLMDWQQITCDDAPSTDDDAASDGDIDIAFGLLLAHEQWSSDGEIDYLTEAQTILSAIMLDEINQNTWSVKLGDWSEASDPNYFYGTRPSDFIVDHYKIFSCYTNNSNWNNVVNTCYSLIEDMQTNYSTTTGLIPDFIIDVNTNPNPAGANYLEGDHDGNYYYNSCRIPWRLGTDYLIFGDNRAKVATNHINTWLLETSNGNVNTISNGYELNGNAIYTWNDATFIGPFTVGAMTDIENQSWLNNLYEDLITNNDLEDGDYYSNTIKLLSMITISGNYWVPECSPLGINLSKPANEAIRIYPNSTKEYINISFGNKITNKSRIGNIIDSKGNVVFTFDLKNKKQQIDLKAFESGIYFISIIIDNQPIFTKRIVKE